MDSKRKEIFSSQTKYGNCLLPEDFIESAQKAFNSHDADLASACYGNNATLELITDGLLDIVEGKSNIRYTWQSIFETFPDFKLEKKMIAHTESKIVNDWKGRIFKNQKLRTTWGIEIWEFSPAGEISYHTLYTFMKVRNATSFWSKIIFGVRHPIIGIQLNDKRKKILK